MTDSPDCTSRVAESVVHGAKFGVFWGMAESVGTNWNVEPSSPAKLGGVRQICSNVLRSGLTFSVYMAAFSCTACLSKRFRNNKDDFLNYLAGSLTIVGVAHANDVMATSRFFTTAKNAILMGATGSFIYTSIYGLLLNNPNKRH
mmetsp:Transcript_17467/g.27909  ORF Transcript_17467/g.27909 Transcript_17467/m.27909 type:complete len:145 (-) Transcript_17467:217-651(-)|eukprot:jgi/Bigna1/58923/fgenesh1_kg.1_\